MENPPSLKAIRLRNHLDELVVMTQAIEEFGEANQLKPKIVFDLTLVLEEIVTNIIDYGYDDGNPHEISLEMELRGGIVQVVVSDDAKPFDILGQKLPDTDAPIEERGVGGLGVLLVRRLMDEVTYRREQGRNVLAMTKRITPD